MWFRDCQAVDVLNVLPTTNSGTIELLYKAYSTHLFYVMPGVSTRHSMGLLMRDGAQVILPLAHTIEHEEVINWPVLIMQ